MRDIYSELGFYKPVELECSDYSYSANGQMNVGRFVNGKPAFISPSIKPTYQIKKKLVIGKLFNFKQATTDEEKEQFLITMTAIRWLAEKGFDIYAFELHKVHRIQCYSFIYTADQDPDIQKILMELNNDCVASSQQVVTRSDLVIVNHDICQKLVNYCVKYQKLKKIYQSDF